MMMMIPIGFRFEELFGEIKGTAHGLRLIRVIRTDNN